MGGGALSRKAWRAQLDLQEPCTAVTDFTATAQLRLYQTKLVCGNINQHSPPLILKPQGSQATVIYLLCM